MNEVAVRKVSAGGGQWNVKSSQRLHELTKKVSNMPLPSTRVSDVRTSPAAKGSAKTKSK